MTPRWACPSIGHLPPVLTSPASGQRRSRPKTPTYQTQGASGTGLSRCFGFCKMAPWGQPSGLLLWDCSNYRRLRGWEGVREKCSSPSYGCKRIRHKVESPGRLIFCHLTASCGRDLSSVSETNQYLTDLEFVKNALEDSGMKLLCEGLKQPNCILQTLRLCASLLPEN
ncbi:NACHT, LRR and PYD domains-containing protein 12-like isoform X2 [Cynocephalus volans]|uniref:NACHT, LRR and PYD domains-containing protein 12-like isoform X2 n=1 Tax=Cynocephalus volans TaxID=110931 RepID=UPI002FC87679